MLLSFCKFSGACNDFIMIDNRENIIKEEDLNRIGKKLCERKRSIGADGTIFIYKNKNVDQEDFGLRIINADGSEAEMCGNGARCAAMYAHRILDYDNQMKFRTKAGLIEANVYNNNKITPNITNVQLIMSLPSEIREEIISYNSLCNKVYWINTGVPHCCVMIEKDIENININEYGHFIRNHQKFQPDGCNANFVQIVNDHTIRIRTYERGVEDETMACGTGSVASALIFKHIANNDITSTMNIINVIVQSGDTLKIHTNKPIPILEGPAELIFQGQLHLFLK